VKFASLRDGSQGGRLLIVSSDQSRAVEASAARTLLSALENWAVCEPVLRSQAALLEANSLYNARPFDPSAVLAPLPRAPQWLDASAFRTPQRTHLPGVGNAESVRRPGPIDVSGRF